MNKTDYTFRIVALAIVWGALAFLSSDGFLLLPTATFEFSLSILLLLAGLMLTFVIWCGPEMVKNYKQVRMTDDEGRPKDNSTDSSEKVDTNVKSLAKLLAFVGSILLIGAIISTLVAHMGDARRYASSFPPGKSYDEIIKVLPQRFVYRDLHRFKNAELPYSTTAAERLNIEPKYVMNINNRFFPFTAPLGYALYFDENKLFMDYACSGL